MSDPFAIFAAALDSKQGMLLTIWPELHNCLARLDGPTEERVLWCAVFAAHPVGTKRKATGRITENGHPACRDCIDAACDIIFGYPLKRVKPS